MTGCGCSCWDESSNHQCGGCGHAGCYHRIGASVEAVDKAIGFSRQELQNVKIELDAVRPIVEAAVAFVKKRPQHSAEWKRLHDAVEAWLQ